MKAMRFTSAMILVILWGCSTLSSECNNIILDNPSHVADSIRKLINLFESDQGMYGRGYFVLPSGGMKMLDDSTGTQTSAVTDVSWGSAASYLRNNGVYSLVISLDYNRWMSGYCMATPDFEYLRYLFVVGNERDLEALPLGERLMVLDRKDDLVLLAPVVPEEE